MAHPARSRLTHDRIDVDGVLRSVVGPRSGGVVLFLGTVRDNSQGRRVKAVEYEAYEPMAERLLGSVEAKVRARWRGVNRVAVSHRLGMLEVGEVSGAVAVSAPHRAESFEACRFAIDSIKHEVPIWKREWFEDGRGEWVEGTVLGSKRARIRPSKAV